MDTPCSVNSVKKSVVTVSSLKTKNQLRGTCGDWRLGTETHHDHRRSLGGGGGPRLGARRLPEAAPADELVDSASNADFHSSPVCKLGLGLLSAKHASATHGLL
jgi:hypothetical protein